MLRLGALTGCVWGALAGPQTDAGWEFLAKSSGAEVPRTCTPTKELPSWVDGSFIIAGPAKFEMGGLTFKSLFDGYGRTNRFEMRKGEVCYTAVWLNTSYYQAAEKLGKIGPGVLFEGTIPDRPPCPLLDPVCDLKAPMDNNWVNSVPMGNEALILTDAPLMLRFNLETLAVTGAYPWEDSLDEKFHKATSGSAHPVLLPGTKSTHIEVVPMLSIIPWHPSKVNIYSFDSNGGKNRTVIASAPMPGVMYWHSFGVTENHVVLPVNMKMGLGGAKVVTHRPAMLDHFEDGWDGIHVVDIKNKSAPVLKFDTTKFYHVHIANTFENATGIVMDIGTDPVIPFRDNAQLTTAKFLNKTLRDDKEGNYPELRRYHLHLAGPLKGSTTYEAMNVPGRMTDFFKINPAFNGVQYCFIYMSEWFHDDKAYASMAILKQDVCKGTKTYWSFNNTYPGEPTFIAKPGSTEEDDGIVVFPSLDGDKGTSSYVILDGKTFKEIASVPLGVHIPFTAHGRFFPKAEMASALQSGSDPAEALRKATGSAYIV